jgi:hypothetical protein
MTVPAALKMTACRLCNGHEAGDIHCDHFVFNDVAQLIDAAKGAGGNRIGLMTAQITAK